MTATDTTTTAPALVAVDEHGNLTDTGRAILDFEGQPWRYAGQKESLIRERFGITSTRYYQILRGLVDERAALEYAPVLVNLRRRQVDERHREPAARHR